MKEKNDIIKFYNDFTSKQGVNKRHVSILSKLKSIGLKSDAHVLELGCGIGSLTILLADYLVNGKLFSIDISPESIEIARKNLIKYQNVKLTAHDIVTYQYGKELYDAIVLPDVLEHIPKEQHSALFEALSKIIKPQGFIHIHIPSPEYLEWCGKNKPELLQIIDQPLHTNELVNSIYPHGFYIHELKTYPIWIKDCDYQHITLRKRGYQDFNISIEDSPSVMDKIKYRLKRKK